MGQAFRVFLLNVLSTCVTIAASMVKSPWKVVAGTGKSGFGGNTLHSLPHGFAVETRLNSPWGLALDPTEDRLYIADSLNNLVRSVNLQTGLIETIAGTGEAGFEGDTAAAATARLHVPTGLALDSAAQVLYVSDTNNHRVRAMGVQPGRVYQAEDTGPVSVEGAEAFYTCPATGATGANANMTPLLLGSAFCRGSTGSGYVRYVHSNHDRISFDVLADAVAGAGEYELRFRYADRADEVHASGGRRLRLYVNGQVLSHEVSFPPTGLPQDGRRDVFAWVVVLAQLVAGQNAVQLEVTGHGGPHVDHLYVVPPRQPIITVAGTGSPGSANDVFTPQPAITSSLHTPLGLALDDVNQYLYIADADNGRVRRLDIAAGTILTVAGGAVYSSDRDGEQARDGKLFRPVGLTLDSSNVYLYIVDAVQGRVRRVDLTTRILVGGTITTISGFHARQAPFEMSLRSPQDIVLDESTGTLFVTDSAQVKTVNLSAGGLCPNLAASRLSCAHPGISPTACVSLGCCFDSQHPLCFSQLSQDGRDAPIGGFEPVDVLTRVDGAERSPPVSFVEGRSDHCCYPLLYSLSTLEQLDAPLGLAWDPREGTLYVSQPRRHRVARLRVADGRCASGAMQC